MAGRLSSYVAVTDEDGVVHWFGPEDTVPGWAAKLITSPAAWADKAGAVADEDGEPPETGAGSGKAAWLAHAESLGVDVGEDATRDDIVAAVRAAGH